MRWGCLVNFKYNEDLGIGISAYKFWDFLHTDSGDFYIHRLAISTYSCVWGTSTYRDWGFLHRVVYGGFLQKVAWDFSIQNLGISHTVHYGCGLYRLCFLGFSVRETPWNSKDPIQ